jgi:TolA-binding protein
LKLKSKLKVATPWCPSFQGVHAFVIFDFRGGVPMQGICLAAWPIALLVLVSCAHPMNTVKSSAPDRTRRIKAEKEVAKLQRELLEIKTQNGLLVAATENSLIETPQEPQELQGDRNSVDPMKQNEVLLYQKAYEAYRSKDERGVIGLENLLKKAFPQSAYLDDIHYLRGLLSMGRQEWTKAISLMDDLQKKFPDSPRVKEAQLNKALIYKKLNLNQEAQKILQGLTPRQQFVKAPRKISKSKSTGAENQ